MNKPEINAAKNIESTQTVESQNWFRIIIGIIAFIVGNIFDYRLTVYGISNGFYPEANPIARGYIIHFGLAKGLLLLKALLSVCIIFGVILFDQLCRKKGINFRSEFILYAGAIATTLAGLLWLT